MWRVGDMHHSWQADAPSFESKVRRGISDLSLTRRETLSGNMLVEIGEGFDRLPSLTVLHMENNRIENIHESFGRCRSLTKLDLSSNNLRQLPATMSKLRKLPKL